MAKVIRCQCGFLGRGETVEEAAADDRRAHALRSSRAGRKGDAGRPERHGRRGIASRHPVAAGAEQEEQCRQQDLITSVPARPRSSTQSGSRGISVSRELRVLDVRGRHPSSSLPHAKRAEYAQSHIPGAVFVDWEHDFIAVDDPVPVQVADPEQFAQRAPASLASAMAICVVTYDDYYGIFAARVAWAFRLYGADSRVLDGGWVTWKEEGRPVDRRADEPTAAVLHRPTERPRLRRTLAKVSRPAAIGAALVDARPRHLFLGEQGVAEHRPHPRRSLPSLPGARRRRHRSMGGAGGGRQACPRCGHRPRRIRPSS